MFVASGINVNLPVESSNPKNPTFATEPLCQRNSIPLSLLSSDPGAVSPPKVKIGSSRETTVELTVVVVPLTVKFPTTDKLLLIKVVPVPAPIFKDVAAPAKLIVVAVVFNNANVLLDVNKLVSNVGDVAKTRAPDPVSSEITPANCALVVAANCANVPPVYATVPPAAKFTDELSVPLNVSVLDIVSVLLVVPPAIENPVAFAVKVNPLTVVNPAMVVTVEPKGTFVEPIVTELLINLALAIDPANIVLVTVPVSPVVITVPVVAGNVIVLVPATATGVTVIVPEVDPGIATLKIPVNAWFAEDLVKPTAVVPTYVVPDVDVASVIPYPANVVGVLVIDDQAGVIVTAAPVDVMRPLTSIVSGVIAVAELLYVPAETPEFARVSPLVTLVEPSKETVHDASPEAVIDLAVCKTVDVAALPVIEIPQVPLAFVPVNDGE